MTPETFMARYEAAKSRRDKVRDLIDDAYEYILPLRERVTRSGTGKPDTSRLFDATAPAAAQDLASEMLDDLFPTDGPAFILEAGRDVPEGDRTEVDRALADVTEEITVELNNSNLRAAVHEALLDWAAVGTGTILPESGDAEHPLHFRALPLADAIHDTGPKDSLDALYRCHEDVKLSDLTLRWPGATLTGELAQKAQARPDDKVAVVEGYWRDWSERGTATWPFMVMVRDGRHVIQQGQTQGWGRQPFITFSYTRVAGEVLGRGPGLLALPDIKTLNLAKEMVLENADLAITGMWQGDDDGVLNPDTIMLAPGTIIPRAAGSKGLEPLQSGADFSIAEFLVKDLQGNIRGVFVGDDLGPPTGTPMSATEVLARSSNRARRRAGPYSRLITDLMQPIVTWSARELVRIGRVKLPAIDGRAVTFRALSPLTRAQAQDEILRHDRFLELSNMRFGPQATLLSVKVEDYQEWLAGKLGVNAKLVRNQVERGKLVQAIAGAAQQAGAMPA
jgi:hypothetical protein